MIKKIVFDGHDGVGKQINRRIRPERRTVHTEMSGPGGDRRVLRRA